MEFIGFYKCCLNRNGLKHGNNPLNYCIVGQISWIFYLGLSKPN